MACNIEIVSVSGKRTAAQTNASVVVVTGTAQDCREIKVAITCNSTQSRTAYVGSSGIWTATFSNIQAMGCTCAGTIGVTAVCLEDSNCTAERSFQLPCTIVGACPYVDDVVVIIDLDPSIDPPCVNDPTRLQVTLMAAGSPQSGLYEWDLGDGNVASGQTLTTVQHIYSFPSPPGKYVAQVTYTPAKAGCQPTTAANLVSVPFCADLETPPPDVDGTVVPQEPAEPRPGALHPPSKADPTWRRPTGSGTSIGCDGLLLAGVALALGGGVTTVVGVCINVLLVTGLGLFLTGFGVVLFLLWFALCGKITACSIMQTVHCSLFFMALITPVFILIIGLLTQSIECAGAVGSFWGLVGWLCLMLGWAMSSANCPRRCGG